MKNHRQGRTGAGERALRRAHARLLLLTLAGVCRELRRAQREPAIQAAYLEIEQHLAWLAARARKADWPGVILPKSR